MTKREQMLGELAPCGLSCRKCVAFGDGDVKKAALEMQRLLGAFGRYAERFASFMPVFKNYPAFEEMLAHFTKATCPGCRDGQRGHPQCGVKMCHREEGVDFCGQCPGFPCGKMDFDPNLRERWLEMNARIKEVGAERYCEESKDHPRYK
jgi:hypothetical protein